ncbi:MAG: hypothetical protein U9Q15_03030 [Patescibacteria group bacterium]|nr:hypothetical protein [Patescibacteria group bacterium]
MIQLQLQQQSIQEIVDFFLVFETQVALLGEMYQINAFDQPGVEFSKIYTKQIITNENS